METKKAKIDEFITHYQLLRGKADNLLTIQKALIENAEVELHGELKVEGKSFPLQELLEGLTEELTKSYTDELSIFIAYLLRMNQLSQEELISSIEWKETGAVLPPTMEMTEEKTAPPLLPFNAKDFIIQELEKYKKEDIINPNDFFDNFPGTVQEQLSISDIHEVLRNYVDNHQFSTIHHATCYKCPTGYSQHYEHLPRDVSCGDCGADIINIEIHYKKLD